LTTGEKKKRRKGGTYDRDAGEAKEPIMALPSAEKRS